MVMTRTCDIIIVMISILCEQPSLRQYPIQGVRKYHSLSKDKKEREWMWRGHLECSMPVLQLYEDLQKNIGSRHVEEGDDNLCDHAEHDGGGRV